MSEQADSAPNLEEQSQPESVSQSEGGQQKPEQVNLPDASELLKAGLQNPEIEDYIRRIAQSEAQSNDAGVERKFRGLLDERLDQFAQELGVNPEDAQKAAEAITMREMLQAYRKGEVQFGEREAGSGKLAGAGARTAASSILGEFGVDPNSPLGKELLATTDNSVYNNHEAVRTSMMREMAKRLNKPSPSEATRTIPGSGSQPAEEPSESVLRKQYEERIKEVKLEAGGRMSPQALSRIKAEFREKGLDVF